ncbi:uncharacterized protein OCT59_014459 [Rhizophagus irregularis]|uniref:uncharacterized protein n=1 Tax=Rhizophagus irregularis TaxID=588596 RepID=UPI0019DB0F07|nr:hypothetical protein OCT59_014459 [Rhizophagus irregularis]GET55262.1 hypothetical protein RIR_jg15569.t1 [Rhizophagus irregularis DAOM 181602=DAOM 197198]
MPISSEDALTVGLFKFGKLGVVAAVGDESEKVLAKHGKTVPAQVSEDVNALTTENLNPIKHLISAVEKNASVGAKMGEGNVETSHSDIDTTGHNRSGNQVVEATHGRVNISKSLFFLDFTEELGKAVTAKAQTFQFLMQGQGGFRAGEHGDIDFKAALKGPQELGVPSVVRNVEASLTLIAQVPVPVNAAIFRAN